MEKREFAKGIFITEKESKSGKSYLEIAIQQDGAYKKYVAFKGTKEAKYGGVMYSVYDKAEQETKSVKEPKNDNLPF